MSKMIDVHALIYEFDESRDSFAKVMSTDSIFTLRTRLEKYGFGVDDSQVEELVAILHHYLTKVGKHDSN